MAEASTSVAGPSAMVDFVAGTVGGVASLLAGHPFDTVKTRLQAQGSTPSSFLPQHASSSSSMEASHSSVKSSTWLAPSSSALHYSAIPSSSGSSSATLSLRHAPTATSGIKLSVPIYSSATDAFRVIIREERVWGLYKGVTSPMLGVAVMNASIFGLYNLALRPLSSLPLLSDAPITQVFIAGMASGLGSSLITAPIDLIKIREQMYVGPKSAKPSTWKVFTDVLRTEGLRKGVYRGWCTTAVRDLGYGPYFASYELLNASIRAGKAPGVELSNLDMALSGALAGVVAWVSTFWADVVKTKIQASTRFDDEKRGAKGRSLFWRTARQTYAEGGWRAFFVGVGPTVLRALPVNAVLFVSYEVTKDFLVKRGY